MPAVCLINSLGLHPHSPSPHIVHALRRLRGSNTAPYSLLVHQLRNFDDDCLDALLAVLKRHPRIFCAEHWRSHARAIVRRARAADCAPAVTVRCQDIVPVPVRHGNAELGSGCGEGCNWA